MGKKKKRLNQKGKNVGSAAKTKNRQTTNERNVDHRERKQKDRATKKALRKKRSKEKHASEQQRLNMKLQKINLQLDSVKADGNCLFRSISKQLRGTEAHHKEYRDQALIYMARNRPDFEYFVEDDEPWEDYLVRMRKDSEWGGHLELKALSDTLRVNFVIHQLDAPNFVMQYSGGTPKQSIHVAYSGMMHYDSIRRLDDSTPKEQIQSPIHIGGIDAVNNCGSCKSVGGRGGMSSIERIVMEETGCPHLQHVRKMLALYNHVVPQTVEELLVQLAMADNSWDRALKEFRKDSISAIKWETAEPDCDIATARHTSENVNYIKTVENVKLITGCPSFELCLMTMENSGEQNNSELIMDFSSSFFYTDLSFC